MSDNETRTFVIRAGVTRNYGAHSVYYEISEQVAVEHGQARRDAFMNLHAQLEDQINVYEATLLQHVKLPAGSAALAPGAETRDTFAIDFISVEHKQGKRYVHVHGGKWKKFGVPAYKECDSALELDTMEYGEHDVIKLGLVATVDLIGGKPKRVVSIK